MHNVAREVKMITVDLISSLYMCGERVIQKYNNFPLHIAVPFGKLSLPSSSVICLFYFTEFLTDSVIEVVKI